MKIEDYLPQVLKEIYEFKAISGAEDSVLSDFKAKAEEIGRELFIKSAEGVGLERWEEALSLEVSTEDSTELRRLRIISELSGGMERLEAMLDSLVGSGNYTVSLYWQELRLVCRLAMSSRAMLKVVKTRLERMIPLNLVLECLLMYRTWNMAADYSWDEVKEYSWIELGEREEL